MTACAPHSQTHAKQPVPMHCTSMPCGPSSGPTVVFAPELSSAFVSRAAFVKLDPLHSSPTGFSTTKRFPLPSRPTPSGRHDRPVATVVVAPVASSTRTT